MAKSIRSKVKQEVRAIRRKQLEENGYFDKSLDKRVAAMQAAMAADPVPRPEPKEPVERMKTEKPKKVPTRKPLEMMDVDGKVEDALKPKAAGIKKKGRIAPNVNAKGKKLGKKDKILFHLGKRTAQKKKAKRQAKQ
uniref:Uncharacterized protein n=1 Tax=Pyramimonas obovata TaxID=1411642 RepID=A0A7S0WSN4_9CHLO|mmetsp:Transcript_3797/g.7832  ORF Transcript_3797/g.7832 Transcript_3797/m.7832 type:complete len:137 (+) Transcript_3797:116-526(+)|eukprot:CAMPEP_0118933500 /NCGR_PEP_ID=MMETSP1169-20130426/12021_1 /TAXON_ID=36882 /ORGANISM="Pyramimonas obovata, Strain CCMP722" /LENGTH=136 /DNA_ID=CAMNT_0006876265 /DNA_START=92 /DNA_END=502 /DNA_ORIENTATION=-